MCVWYFYRENKITQVPAPRSLQCIVGQGKQKRWEQEGGKGKG